MPAKRQGETCAKGVQNPFNAGNFINVASSYQVFVIRPTLLVFVPCIGIDDGFFCFCTIPGLISVTETSRAAGDTFFARQCNEYLIEPQVTRTQGLV